RYGGSWPAMNRCAYVSDVAHEKTPKIWYASHSTPPVMPDLWFLMSVVYCRDGVPGCIPTRSVFPSRYKNEHSPEHFAVKSTPRCWHRVSNSGLWETPTHRTMMKAGQRSDGYPVSTR